MAGIVGPTRPARMTSIKFTVFENDSLFSISQMSEPETFAISLVVDDLLPKVKGDTYWFEVDTCLFPEDLEDEDEEPEYGLVKCYQYNPTPKNGSLGESRIPHPFPEEAFNALKGKTFLVHPKQYGVNPWGKKVEIKFQD